MTLAKALANGLPMGALLAREDAAQAFGPGSHATTFGGTPLVSAAALATIETMLEPGFLAQVVRVGGYFKSRLMDLANRYEFIKSVRGRGLILGLELAFPGGDIQKDLMKKGFLVNVTRDTVVRFVPPLIITEAEVDLLMPALEASVTEAAAKA
jgi:acetylornithine/succinyldiaminopimelate/putrescine aminotransferase